MRGSPDLAGGEGLPLDVAIVITVEERLMRVGTVVPSGRHRERRCLPRDLDRERLVRIESFESFLPTNQTSFRALKICLAERVD